MAVPLSLVRMEDRSRCASVLGSDSGCPWRTLLAAVSLSGLPPAALTQPLRGMAMGQTRRKFGAVSGQARSGWSVIPEAIAQLAARASTQ